MARQDKKSDRLGRLHSKQGAMREKERLADYPREVQNSAENGWAPGLSGARKSPRVHPAKAHHVPGLLVPVADLYRLNLARLRDAARHCPHRSTFPIVRFPRPVPIAPKAESGMAGTLTRAYLAHLHRRLIPKPRE